MMRLDDKEKINGRGNANAPECFLAREGINIIRVTPPSDKMNLLEQKSVSALLEYVVFSRKVKRKKVLAVVSEKFGAADISKLPSKSYDDVIRFLVDFCSEEALENNGAAND